LASYNGENLLSGFGNEVDAALSTALDVAADTGVHRINLSSADEGTYTFIDTSNDNEITLGNGTVTQTVSIGSILDGNKVADGTTVSVNFDTLGIRWCLLATT
jgi:Flp pilus assembly protein TadG